MKKVSKLKLNQLVNQDLTEREMGILKGGGLSSPGCISGTTSGPVESWCWEVNCVNSY